MSIPKLEFSISRLFPQMLAAELATWLDGRQDLDRRILFLEVSMVIYTAQVWLIGHTDTNIWNHI
jgi:hypothetical protein